MQLTFVLSNVGLYGGAMASLQFAILKDGPPSATMMWSLVSHSARLYHPSPRTSDPRIDAKMSGDYRLLGSSG